MAQVSDTPSMLQGPSCYLSMTVLFLVLEIKPWCILRKKKAPQDAIQEVQKTSCSSIIYNFYLKGPESGQ